MLGWRSNQLSYESRPLNSLVERKHNIQHIVIIRFAESGGSGLAAGKEIKVWRWWLVLTLRRTRTEETQGRDVVYCVSHQNWIRSIRFTGLDRLVGQLVSDFV